MDEAEIRALVDDIKANPPHTEEEQNELAFCLMDTLAEVLERRNGIHGMPLGNFVLAPTVVGSTIDEKLGSYLGHNERDPDRWDRMIDEPMLASLDAFLRENESACENLDFMLQSQAHDVQPDITSEPRWLSNGRYAALEAYLYNGRVVETKRVPAETPAHQRLEILLQTTRVRHHATLAKSERVAREKLETLLSPEQREWYEVDGSFFEKSEKSGIHYLLRKSRPTLALKMEAKQQGDNKVRPLCALCFHPFAYHAGTWASVFPPSDEVMTTLLFIRGDEAAFWKRANQIPIEAPQSGV